MLVWSKKYSIGIPRLDADHVMLVSLLNQLHINLAEDMSGEAIGPILDALQHYADGHFIIEESMMTDCGYPGLAGHRERHDGFCIEMARLCLKHRARLDVARSLRALLNTWLFDHVVRADGQFGAWLRANRVSIPPGASSGPDVRRPVRTPATAATATASDRRFAPA